jgi:murein hydrolase activator
VKFLLIVLALCLAVVPTPAAVHAQEPDSTQENEQARRAVEQLKKVQSDIRREEGRLATMRARQADIQAELALAEKEYNAAVAEKTRLEESLQKITIETDSVKMAIAQAKEQASSLGSRLGKRIAAIYKLRRRTADLDYLFRSTSATDLLKRSYYLSLISRSDQLQLALLAAEVVKLGEGENRLNALKNEKEKNFRLTQELEKKLEAKKLAKATLLREEKEKSDLSEKALSKLRSSANKLETIVAGMMGSEEKPPDTKPEKPGQVTVVSAISRASSGLVTVAPFEGEGLSRIKGPLDFPVNGRIIQHYGKQQHEEFADILFIKGLEVTGEVGDSVRAVASGKVMFSDSLPGYGNVVIIDHGARFYTLYGRLGRALCKAGDKVDRSSNIAVLGKPDQKGRNFYFELRVQGKATNPAEYFRKLPASVGK